MKRSTRIIAALLILITLAGPTSAFQTWGTWLPGTTMDSDPVHDHITEVLMTECGFSDYAYDYVIEWMAEQDEVFMPELADPLFHFDNNLLRGSRDRMFTTIERIVGPEFAGSILRDPGKFDELYHLLGEVFHAAQDFYAHSTHIETLLSIYDKGGSEAESLIGRKIKVYEELPLVDWSEDSWARFFHPASVDRSREVPDFAYYKTLSKIRSGYYYGGLTGEMFMDSLDNIYDDLDSEFRSVISLRPKEDYCKFMDCSGGYEDDPEAYLSYEKGIEMATSKFDEMHVYLNKDSNENAMGRLSHKKFQKTLHEIAYNMAQRETVRLWKLMEILIREKYAENADCIIKAIKTGAIPEDCGMQDIVSRSEPLTTGLAAGQEGRMTLYFKSENEVHMEGAPDESSFIKMMGAHKFRGNADLQVDWKTGEIIGHGAVLFAGSPIGNAEITEDGADKIVISADSSFGGKVIPVYVTGWLADGAQRILAIRIYSVAKETVTMNTTSDEGSQSLSGETDVLDISFGDIALDGTPTLSKPTPLPPGPIKMSIREKAWIKAATPAPTGVVPAVYKQTRSKYMDAGPLAKAAKIPLPESYESVMKELKQEMPEMKQLMHEMYDDMAAQEVDASDSPMGSALMAQQKAMMQQAGSPEEIEAKLRKIEEA